MQLKVASWRNVKGPIVIGFRINSFKLIKWKNSSKQLQGSNYRTKKRPGEKRHNVDRIKNNSHNRLKPSLKKGI